MIRPDDEFRHACPPDAARGLWGDTLWVSVVDPGAGVCGVLHFHLTNRGFARFESLCVIDGVQQLYGNKAPLGERPDHGPWSDGRLTYAVVRPLEEIRITFDGPRYAFDLRFTGRFPAFDYADCAGGNPLDRFHRYGGHYEQGLRCAGTFEIRGGPAAGQVRRIDCFGHRDHSWSTRFAEEPPWEPPSGNLPGHFWPSIQLPERHINAFGVIAPESFGLPAGDTPTGGFVASAAGVQALRGASAQALFEDDQRTAAAFRYRLTMPDGEVLHVRTGRKHGQVKLWDRGENDLENRLDCYEPFFDFEVEETGERGTGVAEYSVQPPWPRWLV